MLVVTAETRMAMICLDAVEQIPFHPTPDVHLLATVNSEIFPCTITVAKPNDDNCRRQCAGNHSKCEE
jgi:hypothetical protein